MEHYLLPYIAERHVAHESRSGRAPREGPLLVPVRIPRIQQHYPMLAPAVLQLYEQVQAEQQQQQQQQQELQRQEQQERLQEKEQRQVQQKKKGRRRQQRKQCSSSCFVASTPSSKRLLLVLRCLCLWGRHHVQEQQLPSLLQGLLSRTRAAATAAAPSGGGGVGGIGDPDVQEVIDLTEEDGDDTEEVPQELLERFLAGECEVMLVRAVAGRVEQRGIGVKAELERKDEVDAHAY